MIEISEAQAVHQLNITLIGSLPLSLEYILASRYGVATYACRSPMGVEANVPYLKRLVGRHSALTV